MSASRRNIEETEDSRRTIFIVVAVISAILVAGFIYWMTRPGPSGTGGGQPRLEGALRPGQPEFEQARKLIRVDDPEATEAARAVGDIVMTLRTTVRNFTGRTINGLEMRAAVVDSQNKPVKERTVIVIPTRQPELEHNQTIVVPVMLEGMSKEDDRANIKMEITGIRFK